MNNGPKVEVSADLGFFVESTSTDHHVHAKKDVIVVDSSEKLLELIARLEVLSDDQRKILNLDLAAGWRATPEKARSVGFTDPLAVGLLRQAALRHLEAVSGASWEKLLISAGVDVIIHELSELEEELEIWPEPG